MYLVMVTYAGTKKPELHIENLWGVAMAQYMATSAHETALGNTVRLFHLEGRTTKPDLIAISYP